MWKFILSFSGLFFLSGLFAQDFPVRKFTTQEGLVHNQITCLYQDSRGYLWIGTKAGISRFNGEEFKNYGLKNGLPDHRINGIAEDAAGDIWAITQKGLVCFDGTTWFHYNCKNFCEFIGESSIGFNQQDELYVIHNGQFYGLKNEKLQLIYPFGDLISDTLPVVYHYDRQNDKWLAIQKDQLFSIRNKSSFDVCPIRASYSGNDTFEFLELQDQIFIIQSSESNKKCYHLGNSTLELLSEMKSGIPRILMKFHLPYFFSGGGNIFHYNPETNEFVELFQRSGAGQNSEFILSFNRDFFFAESDAFYQLPGESFTNYEKVLNTWMLALGQNDTVFAGGYFPSSLYKVKGDYIEELILKELYDEINIRLNKNLNHYSFYPGGSFVDNVGYFPFSEGLLEYKAGKLSLIFSDPSGPVLMTHADTVRKVVVCGVTNGIMIVKDGKVIEKFNQLHGLHNNKFITSIAQDKYNRYWLGSSNGVLCFDPDTKKIIHNYTNLTHPDQIKGGVVSMSFDKEGRLWFGTASGLSLLNETNDSLVSVARDEMPIYCSSIIQTDDEYLLIGNSEGLYQFDYKSYFQNGTIRYTLFNQASGFLGEDTVNAMLKDNSGNIWLGCVDNLVKFTPQIDPFAFLELKPVIQNINGSHLGSNRWNPDPILIHDNKISIVYEAIGHVRPSATEFSYRLEGHEIGWNEWTTFRYALYENLPNGHYTFYLKAKSMTTGWSEMQIASVPIRINAPFVNWPTFPYYVATLFFLILLTIMLLVFLYRRAATRQLRLENEAKFLRVQALQAQMNPHFVFNVLASVQNLVMKNDTKLAGQYLAEFGTMIRQFLNASVAGNSFDEIDNNQTIPLKEEISLINTFVHLEQFNYPDRFEYFLEIEDGFNPENYGIPPMIVQPFVENAIKYGLLYSGSNNGKLQLKVRKISDYGYEISILDNGVGRAAAKEFQSKTIKTYKSLGGDLAYERIRILNQMGHKIKLDISDRPGGGTIVTLTFFELL